MIFSVEDLLLNVDFRQWVLQPDAKQNQAWAVRLTGATDEQHELVRQARSILLSLPPEEMISDGEITQLWAAIQRRYHKSEAIDSTPVVRQIGWTTLWYRIAAVFALISLISWLVYTYSGRTIVVHTHFGQHRRISLPDGSRVTLNGNSTLSYPSNWEAQTNREVSLEGEAYFKVTKQRINNQSVKFTVHTSNLNIDVIGTQFNVKNRNGKVDVVLDEGKVQISQLAGTGKKPNLLMKPGDIIEFSKTRKTIRHRQVAHPEQYSAWAHNVLILSNTPLRNIAQTLNETYGLNVTFADDSIANLTFTGNMPANDPVSVLETLTKAFNLQIHHLDDNNVILEPK